MQILGMEHTRKEAVYLFLIIVLLCSFLTLTWSTQKTIDEYEYTYKQNYLNCVRAINDYQNPAVNAWGNVNNQTLGNMNWSMK